MNRWITFWTHLKREYVRIFKVPNNTIVPAMVSVFLYIVIFGQFLGDRIREISGFPYLQFILPGLLLMNVIMGSYMSPSGSLFMARFIGNIHDVLLSPISYRQMVLTYILGGIARGVTLGVGTLLIALIFTPVVVSNVGILLVYIALSSFVFSCLGVLVGLWAEKWEQLNIWLNFLITPLTFFGGVFYSITMIPSTIATITQFNPIFYMIDGTRQGMLGYHEGSLTIGLILLITVSVGLFLLLEHLFKQGWKLRT